MNVIGERGILQASILIVDDSEDYRKVLSTLFKKEGLQVHEADNGQKAMETIRNRKVDIVITDINMPILNGLELLDQIKAFDSGILVFLVTGEDDVELERCISAEKLFLKKLQPPKTILKLVTEVFNSSKLKS